MWMGAALGNAPVPLWLHDKNFVVWKDYMVIPLVLMATGLVVEDRKTVRTVILITAISLLFIDRSCILESMQHSWAKFDESKRDFGPLAYGSNLTAAYLAEFAMFFWGFVQFVKAKKYKLLGYGLIALTVFALMYTFSRGGYAALLFGLLVLGLLKSRKLLVLLGVFLLTWQLIVPVAVRERVIMTKNENGQLESSAEERVELWKEAWDTFVHSPVVGKGFATYGYSHHVVANLEDTHNVFVKVMVETGVLGLILFFILLEQIFALGYRLFRCADDPLYKGLGLGLVLLMCACVVANCFGDRWTYLEISGPLFVLVGAAARAAQLAASELASKPASIARRVPIARQVAMRFDPSLSICN